MKALVVCAGGGIGDVLLATPAMHALRQRYDSVVALTAPAHREVLESNPDLSGVLADEGSFLQVRATLARERFDAAVVTWATGRIAALVAAAGVPVRVGQSRRLYSALFTKRVNVRSESGDRTTHWTQILLDYARALECDTNETVPRFVVGNEDRARAAQLRRETGIGDAYAILHPTRGIAAARERWPAEPLGNLGRALRETYGCDVIVSGAASDRAIADEVARIAGGTSLAARTSLREYGALAEGARFVVAMDSGPMHVAAAVGAPTVGIFALQSDEPDRWRPLGRSTTIVRPHYPCPPSHRKETCPDFACVRALDIGAVLAAVERVHARGAPA